MLRYLTKKRRSLTIEFDNLNLEFLRHVLVIPGPSWSTLVLEDGCGFGSQQLCMDVGTRAAGEFQYLLSFSSCSLEQKSHLPSLAQQVSCTLTAYI